jgi:hypothetical protein
MTMLLIEVFIITAVLFYVTHHALRGQTPKIFLKRFLFCATAAWMAEESSIMLYKFYAYHPVWNFFIADIPIVVVIVWPAIVHSATVLSSDLQPPKSSLIPLIAGCIVLTDAMLIEPVAVNSNLWLWYRPGVFGVPLIGFFGWAIFAFFSTGFFVPVDWLGRIKNNLPMLLVISLIGTHLFVLFSYWIFFKWTMLSISPVFSVVAVWIISAITLSLVFFAKIGCRVKLKTLIVRLPAAIFFYFLLFVEKDSPTPLILYSFAFTMTSYKNSKIRGNESRSIQYQWRWTTLFDKG